MRIPRSALRLFIRSISILALLLIFSLASLLLVLLPAGQAGRRTLLIRNTSFFSRLVLRALGIRVRPLKRSHHPAAERGCLIVANHVSYVDILVIASLHPSVFITSVELRHTFPLGTLAWFGGSIFVERRSPAGLKKEIRDIEEVLRDGRSVVLFPEGTTSDGETVRPFKNSLFTAAIATGVPVLPICLRYRRINGKRITVENKDRIYYHGGTTFLQHAPRLLALRSVHVDCITLDPVPTRPDRSRKDLALYCHTVINAAYHQNNR
jgi:1-acyl-sn-glycerol-3-phosphate acyltransferase